MKLEELKNVRKEKLLAHKRKKREYYLKNKNKEKKVTHDYENDLSDLNFDFKISTYWNIKVIENHFYMNRDKLCLVS